MRNILLVATLAVATQAIEITSPVEFQVVQRADHNRADIKITGKATGNIEARVVSRSGTVLPGLDWKPLGPARSGAFSGSIAQVPIGGPYTLEVRAAGQTASVKNILVGDLWILAGQSNMEGVGNLTDTMPPHEMIHSFDQSDVWQVATEPLHSLPDSADPVHWRKNKEGKLERLIGDAKATYMQTRKKGAGLGLPFAVELFQRTNVPIGLIPCAHGGTSMAQWNPELKSKGGDSLYGSTIRRFDAIGGKVAGILWYQGESDASPVPLGVFADKFEKLIAAFRADFKQPNLPFYYVQIGRHVAANNFVEWNKIQELQRNAEAIPNTGMIASINSTLDDGIHVGTADQKKLGRNFAMMACHDLFPGVGACRDYQRGPRPSAITTVGEGPKFAVRVKFNSVNDKLRADGRISGFTILNKDSQPVMAIYKAVVDPQDPTAVLLYISGKLPEGAQLMYGYTRDPICNLEDALGMAVPVFGPLPI